MGKERRALNMWVEAAYILVWVGHTKWQIFTTYDEMTVYFMILIRCTILYTSKWYKSTGNIFVNIGGMRRNMEKLEKNSESWRLLYILESTENFSAQADFSHQKYLPFPPIKLPLKIGRILGSVGKLCLKMASKHKFVLFPPLFGRTLVPN